MLGDSVAVDGSCVRDGHWVKWARIKVWLVKCLVGFKADIWGFHLLVRSSTLSKKGFDAYVGFVLFLIFILWRVWVMHVV